MGRFQNDETHHCGDKDADDLAHIGAQQELDRLADIVVYPASLLHRADYGGEVVVSQNHIGHVLRNVRTGDPHTHANISGFYRGGVVDAVSGHGGDKARLPPGVDDSDLMLRLDAGINRNVPEGLGKFLVRHLVELGAGDGPGPAAQNTQLRGDGDGCVHVVAGDHNWKNPGAPAFDNGVFYLGAHRIYHAGKAHKAKIPLKAGA